MDCVCKKFLLSICDKNNLIVTMPISNQKKNYSLKNRNQKNELVPFPKKVFSQKKSFWDPFFQFFLDFFYCKKKTRQSHFVGIIRFLPFFLEKNFLKKKRHNYYKKHCFWFRILFPSGCFTKLHKLAFPKTLFSGPSIFLEGASSIIVCVPQIFKWFSSEFFKDFNSIL